MNIKEMLEMDIHDEMRIADTVFVVRVPNGWIYNMFFLGHDDSVINATSTFVPEPEYAPEWNAGRP